MRYTAETNVVYYYEFEDKDVPPGMTPQQWAEQAYDDGYFVLDGREEIVLM